MTGGTDSVGDAQYNYYQPEAEAPCADAVANYLQAKYNIPPHKFYLVGIGKDQEVAGEHHIPPDARRICRVDIKLMSNMSDSK